MHSIPGRNQPRSCLWSIQPDPFAVARSLPIATGYLWGFVPANPRPYRCCDLTTGVSLQGIGLPVEEAMAFWRAEFAPRTPSDKFEKQYAYNIRHNYGKEGNRKSYTPYSCLKIISATPGVVCRSTLQNAAPSSISSAVLYVSGQYTD